MSSSKSGSRARRKEKPHVCETCGKGHSSKRGLAIHANVHTREELYKCDVCSESFSSYSLLRAHKHSHGEAKQVTCGICSKLFSSAAELTSHTLIHKAERPYECDTCGKKFDRQTLQCHMIVETGEKLYVCDTCFERSSKKSEAERKRANSDSKAQKKSHSDTKMYPCHLCSATYSRRQDLKKHVEKHTRHKTKPAPVVEVIEKTALIEPPAPKEKPVPPAVPDITTTPIIPEHNRSHSLTDYVANLNTLIKTKEALLNQKNSSIRSESFFRSKERNPVLTSGVSSDDIRKVCDANMRDVVVSKTAPFQMAKSLEKVDLFSFKNGGKINDRTDSFGLDDEIDSFNEREAMFLQDIKDFPMIDETAIDEENDMLSLLSTDLLHAQHQNLEEQICESYSQMHVNDYFNIGLQEIARQYEDNDLLNAENFEADMRSPTVLYDHRNILSQDFNTVNNYNNLNNRHNKKTKQTTENDSKTVNGDIDIKVELNHDPEIEINKNSAQPIRNCPTNVKRTQSGKHYTNSAPSTNRHLSLPVKKTSSQDVDRRNDIGGRLTSEYIDIEEQSTENFASLLVNDHFSIVDHDDVNHGSFGEEDDNDERVNRSNARTISPMVIHQKRDIKTGSNKYAHSSAIGQRKVLPGGVKGDCFKTYINEIDIKDEFGAHLDSGNRRIDLHEGISPLLLNLKLTNRDDNILPVCSQSEVLPNKRVQENIKDKTTGRKHSLEKECRESKISLEEDNPASPNEDIGEKVTNECCLSQLMQGIELGIKPQTETQNVDLNTRILGGDKDTVKSRESGGTVPEIKTKNNAQFFGIDHRRVLEEDYANTDDEIEHQINTEKNSLIPVNVSCNNHEIIGCLDVEKSRHISRLVVKNQVFTVHLENEAEFNYDAHLKSEKSKLEKQASSDSDIPEMEQQEVEIDEDRYVFEECQQEDALSENRSVRSIDSDDINYTIQTQDSNDQQKCDSDHSLLEDCGSKNDSRLTDDCSTERERCKVSIPVTVHRVEESDDESNSKIMTDKVSDDICEETEEESDEKRVYVRFVYCPKNIDSGTNDSSSDNTHSRRERVRRNDKLTEVTVREIHDQNSKNWTINKKYCKLIIDQESVMQEGDQLLDDESVIYKYQSDEKDDQSVDNDTSNMDEDDVGIQCVVQDSETDDPDTLADFSGNSNQIVVDEDTIIDYQEVEVKTDENYNGHYLRIAEDSQECVRVPIHERLIETDDDEDLYASENSMGDHRETLADDSEQSNQIIDNESLISGNREIDQQSSIDGNPIDENNDAYMQDNESGRDIDESSMTYYRDDENESEKGDNQESFSGDANQTLAGDTFIANSQEAVIRYDQNNSPLSMSSNLIIDHEGNVLQYTDKSNQAFGNESLIVDHQEIIGQDSNTGDSTLVHCYVIDENQENGVDSSLNADQEPKETRASERHSAIVQTVEIAALKVFDTETDTEKSQSSILNQLSEDSQCTVVEEHHTEISSPEHQEIASDSINTVKNTDNPLIIKNDLVIVDQNTLDKDDQDSGFLRSDGDSQPTSHIESELWRGKGHSDSPILAECHSAAVDDQNGDSNYSDNTRNETNPDNTDCKISQEIPIPNLDANVDYIPVKESEEDKLITSFDSTLLVSVKSCYLKTVDDDLEILPNHSSTDSDDHSKTTCEEIAVPIQITDPVVSSELSNEETMKKHSDIEGTIKLFNETLVLDVGVDKPQVKDSMVCIDRKENVSDQTYTPDVIYDITAEEIDIDETATMINDKLILNEPVSKDADKLDEHSISVKSHHVKDKRDACFNVERDIVVKQQKIEIKSTEENACSTPEVNFVEENNDKNIPKSNSKTCKKNNNTKKSKTLAMIVEKLRIRVSSNFYNLPFPGYGSDSPIDLSMNRDKITVRCFEDKPLAVGTSIHKFQQASETTINKEDNAISGDGIDSNVTNRGRVTDIEIKHLDCAVIKRGSGSCEIDKSVVSKTNDQKLKADNQTVIQKSFDHAQMKEVETVSLLKDNLACGGILTVETGNTEMVDENDSLPVLACQKITIMEDGIHSVDNTHTVDRVDNTFESVEHLNVKIITIPEVPEEQNSVTYTDGIINDKFETVKTTNDNISKELIKLSDDHLNNKKITFSVRHKKDSSFQSCHYSNIGQIYRDTIKTANHSKIIIYKSQMDFLDETDQADVEIIKVDQSIEEKIMEDDKMDSAVKINCSDKIIKLNVNKEGINVPDGHLENKMDSVHSIAYIDQVNQDEARNIKSKVQILPNLVDNSNHSNKGDVVSITDHHFVTQVSTIETDSTGNTGQSGDMKAVDVTQAFEENLKEKKIRVQNKIITAQEYEVGTIEKSPVHSDAAEDDRNECVIMSYDKSDTSENNEYIDEDTKNNASKSVVEEVMDVENNHLTIEEFLEENLPLENDSLNIETQQILHSVDHKNKKIILSHNDKTVEILRSNDDSNEVHGINDQSNICEAEVDRVRLVHLNIDQDYNHSIETTETEEIIEPINHCDQMEDTAKRGIVINDPSEEYQENMALNEKFRPEIKKSDCTGVIPEKAEINEGIPIDERSAFVESLVIDKGNHYLVKKRKTNSISSDCQEISTTDDSQTDCTTNEKSETLTFIDDHIPIDIKLIGPTDNSEHVQSKTTDSTKKEHHLSNEIDDQEIIKPQNMYINKSITERNLPQGYCNATDGSSSQFSTHHQAENNHSNIELNETEPVNDIFDAQKELLSVKETELIASPHSRDDRIIITDTQETVVIIDQSIEVEHVVNEIEMSDVNEESLKNHFTVLSEAVTVSSKLTENEIALQQHELAEQFTINDNQGHVGNVSVLSQTIVSKNELLDTGKDIELEGNQIASVNDDIVTNVEQSNCNEISDKEHIHEITVDSDIVLDKTEINHQNEHHDISIINPDIDQTTDKGDNQKEIDLNSKKNVVESPAKDIESIEDKCLDEHDKMCVDNFKTAEILPESVQNEHLKVEYINVEPKSNEDLCAILDKDSSNVFTEESSIYSDEISVHIPLSDPLSESLKHVQKPVIGVENENHSVLIVGYSVTNLSLETSDIEADRLGCNKDVMEERYLSRFNVSKAIPETSEAKIRISKDNQLDEKIECKETISHVINQAQISNQTLIVSIDKTGSQSYVNGDLSSDEQLIKVKNHSSDYKVSCEKLNDNDQEMLPVEQTNNLIPMDHNKQQISEIQNEIDVDLQGKNLETSIDRLKIINQECIVPVDDNDIQIPTDGDLNAKINETEPQCVQKIDGIQSADMECKQLVDYQEAMPIDSIVVQRSVSDHLEGQQVSIGLKCDHDTEKKYDRKEFVEVSQNILEETKCGQITSDCSNADDQEIAMPLGQTDKQTVNVCEFSVKDHSMENHDDKEKSLGEDDIVKFSVDSSNARNQENSSSIIDSIDTQTPTVDSETVNEHLVTQIVQKEIDERKCAQIEPHDLNVSNQKISTSHQVADKPILVIDDFIPNPQVIDEKESKMASTNLNFDKQDCTVFLDTLSDNLPSNEKGTTVKVDYRNHDDKMISDEEIASHDLEIVQPITQSPISENVKPDQQPEIEVGIEIVKDTKVGIDEHNDHLNIQDQESALPIDTQVLNNDSLIFQQSLTIKNDQEQCANRLNDENQDIAVITDQADNEKSIGNSLTTKQPLSVQDGQENNDNEMKHGEEECLLLDSNNLDAGQKIISILPIDVKTPDKVIVSIEPQILGNHQSPFMEFNIEPDQNQWVISNVRSLCTQISASNLTEKTVIENKELRLDEVKYTKQNHECVGQKIDLPIDSQILIIGSLTAEQSTIDAQNDQAHNIDMSFGKVKSGHDRLNVDQEIILPINLLDTKTSIGENVMFKQQAIEARVAELVADEVKSDHDPSIDTQEILVPIVTKDIQIPITCNLKDDKKYSLEVQPASLPSDIQKVEEQNQQENDNVLEENNVELNDQWVVKCEEIILPTEEIDIDTGAEESSSSGSMDDISSMKCIHTQVNVPGDIEDELSNIKYQDVDSNKNNINVLNRVTEIECKNDKTSPIVKLNLCHQEFGPIDSTENKGQVNSHGALFEKNCSLRYEQVPNEHLSVGQEITEVQKNNLNHENVPLNVDHSEQVTEADSDISMVQNDREADASILKHFNPDNNFIIIKQIERLINVHSVDPELNDVGVPSDGNSDSQAMLPLAVDGNAPMLVLDPLIVENIIEKPAGTNRSKINDDQLIVNNKGTEEHNLGDVDQEIVLHTDDNDPGVLIEYIDMNNTFIEEVCNLGEPFSLIDDSDPMIDDLILDNHNIFIDDQEIDSQNTSAVISRKEHSYSLNIDEGFFNEFGPLNKNKIVKVLVGIENENGDVVYKEVNPRIEDNADHSAVDPDKGTPDALADKYAENKNNRVEVHDRSTPEIIGNIDDINVVDQSQSVNEETTLAPQASATDIIGWKKYKRFFSDRKSNCNSVTEELLAKLKKNGSEVDVVLEALKKSCPSIKNIMNDKHALKKLESATANNLPVDNLEKRNREVRTAVKIFRKRLAYKEMKKNSTNENDLTADFNGDLQNTAKSSNDNRTYIRKSVDISKNFQNISISDKDKATNNVEEIDNNTIEANNNSPRINAAITSLIHKKSHDKVSDFTQNKFKNKIIIKGTKRSFNKPLIISQLSNFNKNTNTLDAFIISKKNATVLRASDHEIPTNKKEDLSTCQSQGAIDKTDVPRHHRPTKVSEVLFKTCDEKTKMVNGEDVHHIQQRKKQSKRLSHDNVSLVINALDMRNVPENVRNDFITTNKQGILSLNDNAVVKLKKIDIEKLEETFNSAIEPREYKVNYLNKRVSMYNGKEENLMNKSQLKSSTDKNEILTEAISVDRIDESIFLQKKGKVSNNESIPNVKNQIISTQAGIDVLNRSNSNSLTVSDSNRDVKVIKPMRRIIKVIRAKGDKISSLPPKKDGVGVLNGLTKNADKNMSKENSKAIEVNDCLEKPSQNDERKVLIMKPNGKQLIKGSGDRSTDKIDFRNESSKKIHIISEQVVNGPISSSVSSSAVSEKNLEEIVRNNETVLKTLEMCSLSQEVRKNLMSVDQNGEVLINDEAFIELGKIINNIELPPEILRKISIRFLDTSVLKNNNDSIKINYDSQEIKEYLLAAINNRRVSLNLVEDLASVLKESDNSGLLADSLNDSGINERKGSDLSPVNKSSTRSSDEVLIKNTTHQTASENVNEKCNLTQRRIIKINAPKRKMLFPLLKTENVKLMKLDLDSQINGKTAENRILNGLSENSTKNAEEQILLEENNLETREHDANSVSHKDIVKTGGFKESVLTLQNNSTSYEKILNLDNNLLSKTVEDKNVMLKRRKSTQDIDGRIVVLKQNVQNATGSGSETSFSIVTTLSDADGNYFRNEGGKDPDNISVEEDADRELKRKRIEEMELLQDLKDSDDYIVVIVGDKGAEIRQTPSAQGDKVVDKSIIDTPRTKRRRFEKKNKKKRSGSKSSKNVNKEPSATNAMKAKRKKRKNLGVKEFPCTQCDKVCKFSNALLVHMRIHTNERPFACQLCDKRFKVKSALKCHSVVHTADRPFECDKCKKRFKTRTVLESHMRFHVGEKRFECDICSKKFIQKQSLMIHLNLHTGATPWACDICFKRFKQPATLVKHHRSHTVKRPFGCTNCRKYFSTSAGLRTHCKMHDKEKEILNS